MCWFPDPSSADTEFYVALISGWFSGGNYFVCKYDSFGTWMIWDVDSLIRAFVHSFVHSNIHSCIHSLVHSYNHSFVQLHCAFESFYEWIWTDTTLGHEWNADDNELDWQNWTECESKSDITHRRTLHIKSVSQQNMLSKECFRIPYISYHFIATYFSQVCFFYKVRQGESPYHYLIHFCLNVFFLAKPVFSQICFSIRLRGDWESRLISFIFV